MNYAAQGRTGYSGSSRDHGLGICLRQRKYVGGRSLRTVGERKSVFPITLTPFLNERLALGCEGLEFPQNSRTPGSWPM